MATSPAAIETNACKSDIAINALTIEVITFKIAVGVFP